MSVRRRSPGLSCALDPLLGRTLYVGVCMSPALKPLDRLEVSPCDGRRVRLGDIVVFRRPGGNRKVAHRVISLEAPGIVRTRGDRNLVPDEWIITPDAIIGRVVYARRGKKRVRVYGGAIGRVSAFVITAFVRIKARLYSLARPVYLRLAKSGILRIFVPFRLKARVVSFRRPQGIELQLFVGKRPIGNLPPGGRQWKIRPPFRLFIDETSLFT